MKKLLAFALIVFASAIIVFAPSPTDADTTGVLICEVNGIADDDGVSLHNYGSKNIDLKNYRIADNTSKSREGYIAFESSLILHPGDTITVMKADAPGSKFIDRHPTYYPGSNGLKMYGSFDLSKNDEVYLYDSSDKIIDAVCYGTQKISDTSIWNGSPFKIKSGCYAFRDDVDTDSASDWYNFKVGWLNIRFDPSVEYDATVTPFLLPESGGIPVFEELEKADESVIISIYILGSQDICALLDSLLKKDVKVSILLETESVPVTVKQSLESIQTLVDHGADVRFIDYQGRYAYMHSKYCIIDNDTVLITSENWTAKSMNREVVDDPYGGEGYRGWGAIIESPEYAAFMKTVFDNDFDKSYGDVHDFTDLKTVTGRTLTYTPTTSSYPTQSYECTVTPMMSPDSSWDGTTYYIDNATQRVYSQQQSLTESYATFEKDTPLKSMKEKAEEGLDVKFMLSSVQADSDSNKPKPNEKALELVRKINTESVIKASGMGTKYIHNKGVICDDTCLISSVNWTDTSFKDNREMCVAVHSKQIADYFAASFNSDFNKNYTDGGLRVVITELSDHYDDNKDIKASVVVSPPVAVTYKWFLDGKSLEKEIQRIKLEPSDGKHNLKVIVTYEGEEYSASKTFTVGNSEEESTSFLDNETVEEYGTYAIPAIAIILGLLVALVKGSSGKKKKKKGGKKR
ncbi:MAG: hypothetical protein E7Z64_01715 [Thermoplasmata archaeon]|nr:hypothetical protein [Thermoplasmata archaeon]